MDPRASRPYEERQHQPGDYDAQVSQRDIAIHGLEHLATTDEGIIMFRKLVRDGIRAVQRGEDPRGLLMEDTKGIPTYSQDTIMRIPRRPTDEEDTQLLREMGSKIAREGFTNHPTMARR